ncbi:MAG: hypothetical protein AB7K86_19590 [Rhodospirillales bacterium]
MRRLLMLLCLGLPWPGAARGECTDPPVSVLATIAGSDRRAFEESMHAAIAKVCAWWGPSFDGVWRVEIDAGRGPSMALVPAWRGDRGRMLFRAGAVRAGRAAVVHEVVHVFAPNANRFLAEGLAVYAHEHLGGVAAHPNFGDDLHRAARPFAAAEIAALDRIATPQQLGTDTLDEKSAYLVAGSFVRYLIETHGLAAFRRLYEATPLTPGTRDAGRPERWQAVYGVGLDRLAAEWRATVGMP